MMKKTALGVVIALALVFCGCESGPAETSSAAPIPIPENPTVIWSGGASYDM
ncbi:MAG: hypothetical protein KH216_13085 [Clostridiales bacterium]|nr:hypothetical protein [Clostridiales bacterium]